MEKKYNQQFKKDKTIVFFRVDEGELICPNKNRDKSLVLEVIVQEGKKIKSMYYRYFKTIPPLDEYTLFIKKFLSNPTYRKQFLVKSYKNWTGVIDIVNSKGVNKMCEEKIKELNKKSICSFDDLINLKTYGLDKASSLKANDLEKILNKEDIDKIKQSFSDSKQILTAMRWNYRGLNVRHCIKKVETDYKQQLKYSKKF